MWAWKKSLFQDTNPVILTWCLIIMPYYLISHFWPGISSLWLQNISSFCLTNTVFFGLGILSIWDTNSLQDISLFWVDLKKNYFDLLNHFEISSYFDIFILFYIYLLSCHFDLLTHFNLSNFFHLVSCHFDLVSRSKMI